MTIFSYSRQNIILLKCKDYILSDLGHIFYFKMNFSYKSEIPQLIFYFFLLYFPSKIFKNVSRWTLSIPILKLRCVFLCTVYGVFFLFKLQELVHRLWNIQLTGFDLWRNLWTVGNKDQVCGPIYKSLPLPDRLYSAHSSIKVTGWFLIGIFRYVILRHNICVFVEIGSCFL